MVSNIRQKAFDIVFMKVIGVAILKYKRRNNRLKLALTALILTTIIMVQIVVHAAAPNVNAKAYIVVDSDTGEILCEKNSADVLVPASMTKLMTIYLTLENVNSGNISWSDRVKIGEYSNKISKHPSLSSYQLPLNSYFTVEELFTGAVLNSSNASSISLAEHMGGDETGFVSMMNSKARNFGLTDTKFINSMGLNNSDLYGYHPRETGENDDNKISARSMAVVAYRLLNDYPEVVNYTSLPQKKIREGQPDEILIKSTNRFLTNRDYSLEGAKGLKTGYIFNAGYCFAGYTERQAGRLISVVMGAETSDERFRGSAKLLEYGYELLKDRESAESRKYLYPNKLNFYNSPDSVSDPLVVDNDGNEIFSYGNTGFGVMTGGRSDVIMYN
jgi:D-alanyl-D-alanine carboxypeptidase (penicillin-binding protein 5/6)